MRVADIPAILWYRLDVAVIVDHAVRGTKPHVAPDTVAAV
jgi:hypothetical protein